MNIFFLLFLLGVAGLVAFSIHFLLKGYSPDESKQRETEDKESSRRMEILRLEDKINSQEANIERLQQERKTILEDFDASKKSELEGSKLDYLYCHFCRRTQKFNSRVFFFFRQLAQYSRR